MSCRKEHYCGICGYCVSERKYEKFLDKYEYRTHYYCHRNPPQVVFSQYTHTSTYFPEVRIDDWCGECGEWREN